MAISGNWTAAWLATVGFVAVLAGGPAQAQQAERPPGKVPASGVLHPPGQVDPQMTHRTPKLPAQSMPVIRPKLRDRNGTLTVPR